MASLGGVCQSTPRSPCARQCVARCRDRAQEAQAQRNRLSREIGARQGCAVWMSSVLVDSQRAATREAEANEAAEAARLRTEIDEILAGLPNLPAEDVPDGPDETANRVLRHHGEPPRFDFAPMPHEAVGERLGLMDFARAGKLSGSRFVVLRGALARLERALGQFMLDLHTTEFGYTEVSPPRVGARRNHVRHRPAAESLPRSCSAPQTATG